MYISDKYSSCKKMMKERARERVSTATAKQHNKKKDSISHAYKHTNININTGRARYNAPTSQKQHHFPTAPEELQKTLATAQEYARQHGSQPPHPVNGARLPQHSVMTSARTSRYTA